MKRLFPMLLMFPILTLSVMGCKDNRATAAEKVVSEPISTRVISENNKNSNAEKVKDGDKAEVSTISDIVVDTLVDSEITADDLVKRAMETKPTAKVVSKPTDKPDISTTRPVKKPKPNPVKSAPIKYLPKVEFDEMTYDFGEIVEGDIIKHNFTFTNTGKTNLSIEKATATCGCTKPSFPFIDIKPGETGYIGVTYNSVNKKGDQKPEITVYSNAYPKVTTLYLTGKVMPKPQEDKEEDKLENTPLEMPIDTVKN